MLIHSKSILTGEQRSKDIAGLTYEQLDAWHDGILIQTAMPDVSAVDRDFIKGIFEDEMPLPLDDEDEDLEAMVASIPNGLF
jgi:hypothetical protein